MRHRLALSVFVLAATLSSSARAPISPVDPSPLVVHEWGTFTSVAGPDGRAVSWLPLSGPQDLPCFVDRIGFGIKPNLSGSIRMETPVLYFYAPEETAVDVTVRFRQGAITEWYPRASVRPAMLDSRTDLNALESEARWTRVLIRPGARPSYPVEPGTSHYYAARETDAAPVQVGQQLEKFLFYRGVGAFAPPLTASVSADDRVTVSSTHGGPLGDLVLFDRGGDRTRYRVDSISSRRTTLAKPAAGDLPALHRQLERMLVSHGLYPREARAMIETWKDSWFEDGTRLIYIVPAGFVDAVLPLEIRPRPSEVARVFVGRVELLTDARLASIKAAMLRNDVTALASHGRFLWPAVERVMAAASPAEVGRLGGALSFVYRMPVYDLACR